jgi:hypothetical protein
MCKYFSSPSMWREWNGCRKGRIDHSGKNILEGTFWKEHSGRNILEGIETSCLVGGSDSGLHVNGPSSNKKNIIKYIDTHLYLYLIIKIRVL